MTVISQNQTTSVVVATADEALIIDTGVTVRTSGLGIDASGAVSGRQFTINGTLRSTSGTGMVLGDASLADSGSSFKVSDVGSFISGGKGLVAYSGGLQFTNVGTFRAVGTALDLRTGGNTVENDASLTSTGGIAIRTLGRGDEINNTGAAALAASSYAIWSTGDRTSINNDGTASVASSAGTAIWASGKADTINTTSTIEARLDAIVFSGLKTSFTNSGNGTVESSAGRGVVAKGSYATVTNQAEITARLDAIASYGAHAVITNNDEVTSTAGAAIRSDGDDATVTNTTLLSGKTYGIFSTGDDVTITNYDAIRSSGYAIRVGGDDAVITTKGEVTGSTALWISGDDATVTNTNLIEGLSKSAAAIRIGASGETALTNKSAIEAASGIAIQAGSGDEHILNTGTIDGKVMLGAGDDWFSALKGSVTGAVYGGKGDDIFVTGISLKIVENTGEGNDTVQSRYSWTIGANIENIELLGSLNVNATGNGLDNVITGNSGNNLLSGKGGNDVFLFETDFGRDTIGDFTDGKDRIDVSDYDGIRRFSDLSGKIHTSGDNAVIVFDSHDRLTLLNVEKSDLTASDFIF